MIKKVLNIIVGLIAASVVIIGAFGLYVIVCFASLVNSMPHDSNGRNPFTGIMIGSNPNH